MFSISDLAEQSGVSVRTIRYYVAEGLLPVPRKRGRYAKYGSEYLDRLKLIGALKRTFLPLAEIRTRVTGMTDREVASLVEVGPTAVSVNSGRSQAVSEEDSDRDAVQEPSSWIRYRIEDGIELNVMVPLHPWRERIVRRMIADLRSAVQDW